MKSAERLDFWSVTQSLVLSLGTHSANSLLAAPDRALCLHSLLTQSSLDHSHLAVTRALSKVAS